MKVFAGVLLALVAVLGLGWVLTANDLALASVFSPRYEQVRYNTFKQSQAYNDGMVNDLAKLQLEYAQADGTGKQLLQSVILQRYGAYDATKLPPDLQQFLAQIKLTSTTPNNR